MSESQRPPQDDYEWQAPEQRRPRRLEEAEVAEVGFPVAWILIGGLAGLITIGLIGLGVVNIVRKQAITPTPGTLPAIVETVEITPPVSVGVTPGAVGETVEPGTTPAEAAPAETPAATEETTPEAPPVPEELAIGGWAKVVGTEGVGLSMRAGPGTNNVRVGVAEDDTVVEIIGGPRNDENLQSFIWWFVRHPDDTEGWVVQDFIEPTLAPE
jgi:hypothetical protein